MYDSTEIGTLNSRIHRVKKQSGSCQGLEEEENMELELKVQSFNEIDEKFQRGIVVMVTYYVNVPNAI